MLISSRGQAIRFKEKDVRPMGRAAGGVRGIRLKTGDYLVGMDIIEPKEAKNLQVMVMMENGFGKRSELKYYKVQHRGGGGIRTAKVTKKTGKVMLGVVANAGAMEGQDILVISKKGQVIRIPFDTINLIGRDTQGVRLMRFKEENDTLATFSMIDVD
jgi:DNA gyrase subunit A